MEPTSRRKIFELAAQKLRQDFLELRTVPHAGLRGGEAEDLIRRFLKGHIPRRYDVGSGFILDQRDRVSPQTDVIVYDALNCPTYRASESAAVYPANNVAAVIEVKSKLDGRELDDAFNKVASVKSLSKFRGKTDGPWLDQTHGSIVAFESALSLDTVADRYLERLRANGFGHHADVICILDRGLVTPVASLPGEQGWGISYLEGLGPSAEGSHFGVGEHRLEQGTLDSWFRLLLAHLGLFRNVMDHPGFRWSEGLPQGMARISYLGSFTAEKDPERRKRTLAQYGKQAREELAKHPVPPD